MHFSRYIYFSTHEELKLGYIAINVLFKRPIPLHIVFVWSLQCSSPDRMEDTVDLCVMLSLFHLRLERGSVVFVDCNVFLRIQFLQSPEQKCEAVRQER